MVWIIMMIIFIIIEAATLGLATIWLAIGSLVAWVTTMIGAPIGVQIFVFIIVSFCLLYFTRPIIKKWLKLGNAKTNVDSLIGKKGIVLIDINPIEAKGQVKVSGQIWSAISEDQQIIKKNEQVIIQGVKGVKLIIKKINESED